MESKWLTTEEAADFLGMGKTKLYALSQSGRIPVSKVGKARRFCAACFKKVLMKTQADVTELESL